MDTGWKIVLIVFGSLIGAWIAPMIPRLAFYFAGDPLGPGPTTAGWVASGAALALGGWLVWRVAKKSS